MVLMTFAMDRHTSLDMHPYNVARNLFLMNGHRVMSFDLPNHGERVNEFGEGITGWRNALMQGVDPFIMFIEEGSAAIDMMIEAGLARGGNIVVEGTSRQGYMAMRLLAADLRVSAASLYCPVTDWRELQEFEQDAQLDRIAALQLTHYCSGAEGKPLYIAIGNHDLRVSTISCCKFHLHVTEHYRSRGYDSNFIDFYCTDDPGHSVDDLWRTKGAEFLLQHHVISSQNKSRSF